MIFIKHLVNLFSGLMVSRLNNLDSWVDNFRSGEIHEVFVNSKSSNISDALKKDLEENLWIKWITWLKVYRNYLVQWLTDNEFSRVKSRVLSESPVDKVYNEETFKSDNEWKQILVIESAPGQYDTRVDAINKNISLVTWKTEATSRYKDVISFEWNISPEDMDKIKKYLINPNEKIESGVDQKSFDRLLA